MCIHNAIFHKQVLRLLLVKMCIWREDIYFNYVLEPTRLLVLVLAMSK